MISVTAQVQIASDEVFGKYNKEVSGSSTHLAGMHNETRLHFLAKQRKEGKIVLTFHLTNEAVDIMANSDNIFVIEALTCNGREKLMEMWRDILSNKTGTFLDGAVEVTSAPAL
jgi:hypothetical protein